MKIRITIIIQLIIVLTIFLSCIKEEDFSEVPHIDYMDFTKIQTTNNIDEKGILKIFFTDGDGDMGLDDGDSLPPFDKTSIYYYNFFITYFEKQHGQFVEVQLPMPFHSRIPRLTSTSRNGAIKGEIEIELLTNNPFSAYDTIRFDAYIADRALHESNIISTPEIIVKKH